MRNNIMDLDKYPRLFILDFDNTLTNSSGMVKTDMIKILTKDYSHLAIASRNDPYTVINRLRQANVLGYFKYIMCDFRPKHYQVRHILYLYQTRHGKKFESVFFIDDSPDNIELVKQDNPSVKCILFSDSDTIKEVL